MSIHRPLATAAALALTLASAAAVLPPADEAADPKPPAKSYSDAEKGDQTLIHEFSGVPDEVPTPKATVWDQKGFPDGLTPEKRYLKPKHPHVQPRPDDSTHFRYEAVPNDVEKIPQYKRPAAETEDSFRYRTLPEVVPPCQLTVTYVRSAEGIFPKVDPFEKPPGTNLLPTFYREAFDGCDQVMPNTLASTTRAPFNLHDGPPLVSRINAASPADDLQAAYEQAYRILTGEAWRRDWERRHPVKRADLMARASAQGARARNESVQLRFQLRQALSIIQGRTYSTSTERLPEPGKAVVGRAYDGFPLIHHSGHKRVKKVMPVFDKGGEVTGSHVDVHQVWYDTRIESDTMYFKFPGHEENASEAAKAALDKPWTITYTVDVLSRGADDFATTTMYFDNPKAEETYAKNKKAQEPGKADEKTRRNRLNERLQFRTLRRSDAPLSVDEAKAGEDKPPRLPHISMDQTFYPLREGTRTVITVKMAPPKYYNLTYTWAWRVHPPRAQATENGDKVFPKDDSKTPPQSVVTYESEVFEPGDPFDKISDLAPEKRMFRAFEGALSAVDRTTPDYPDCLAWLLDARHAYLEWQDRNHLPSGIKPDPKSELTLLYVNNTIYGEITDHAWSELINWTERPHPLKVTLFNGDYFEHSYLNVDFGNNRGWENQFKPTLKEAGSGTFFTFGRFHYRFNTPPGAINVEAARRTMKDGGGVASGQTPDRVTPGVHRLWIELNHDPGRRLRFYQFDPKHHDVAIFSVH